MNEQKDTDPATTVTDPLKEPQMLPAWLLLAAKLAIELKPAISHLIKRYLSK